MGVKRVSTNEREISAVNATWTVGRKRIALESNCHGNSGELCLRERRGLSRVDCSPVFFRQAHLARNCDIESLPLDILVRIICNLHHEELKPLTHVSSKFREALVIARKMHFDYSTPTRVRAPKRGAIFLMSNESSENYPSTFEGLEYLYSSSERPATPDAPKQASKFQKPRIFSEDTKEFPTMLLPPGTPAKNGDTTFPNQSHFFKSGGGITNRVLFAEDDLCEAVVRNRL